MRINNVIGWPVGGSPLVNKLIEGHFPTNRRAFNIALFGLRETFLAKWAGLFCLFVFCCCCLITKWVILTKWVVYYPVGPILHPTRVHVHCVQQGTPRIALNIGERFDCLVWSLWYLTQNCIFLNHNILLTWQNVKYRIPKRPRVDQNHAMYTDVLNDVCQLTFILVKH